MRRTIRITLQKRADFAFSMQNRIHYFGWTAGLIVVTNSFLTGTKNDKYGKLGHNEGSKKVNPIFNDPTEEGRSPPTATTLKTGKGVVGGNGILWSTSSVGPQLYSK